MTCRTAIVAIVSVFVLLDNAVAEAACQVPPLRQGMPYAKARRVVLDHGFQAPTLPPYGYKAGDQKVVSNCFNDELLCNRYPEIDSCSGQGQCAMKFEDAFGHKLSIYTYGELDHEGPEVTSFEIRCE